MDATLDKMLCFSLYAASRAMTAAYGPVLEPLGLTYPQYLVMLLLWERDGQSVTELGDQLQLDSGTLTPLLKKLEAAGVLVKARDEADARVVRVRLTAQGKALRKKAASVPHSILCLSGLKITELARLREELKSLTTTLREANASSKHQEHAS
ncbi:MAG: MarR family transcriptional regulator [Myxococcaceae bacterium]